MNLADAGQKFREYTGKIRVNQSGSVALSAEEVRGPPQRNRLIIMALLTQESGYEPGGRGSEFSLLKNGVY